MKQKSKLVYISFGYLLLVSLALIACVPGPLTGVKVHCRPSGIQSIDVAPDDSTLVFSYCDKKTSYIATADINGPDVNIIAQAGDNDRVRYDRVIFSPEGRKVFFIKRSLRDKSHLYSINIDGSNLQQITSGQSGTENIQDIALSQDGRRIYYINSGVLRAYSPIAAAHPHDMDFYSMNSDGSNIHRITDFNAYALYGLTVSHDERLLYHRSGIVNTKTGQDLTALPFTVFPFPVAPFAGFTDADLTYTTRYPLSKVSSRQQIVLSCAKDSEHGRGRFPKVDGYGLYLNDLEKRQITKEIIWVPASLDSPTFLNKDDVILFIRKKHKKNTPYGGKYPRELWRVKLDGSELAKIDLDLS